MRGALFGEIIKELQKEYGLSEEEAVKYKKGKIAPDEKQQLQGGARGRLYK